MVPYTVSVSPQRQTANMAAFKQAIQSISLVLEFSNLILYPSEHSYLSKVYWQDWMYTGHLKDKGHIHTMPADCIY